MPKMNADDIARTNFQPGDLVRWIGEWPFPLVDAPPRENTVLAIENDGKVHLEGRHGGEGPQRWWCPPDQLIYRESVQVAALEVDPSPQGAGAAQDAIKADTLKVEHGEANSKIAERLRRIMSTCFDGSRSGDLAFQLADMEEWIPKFTSEWKANHRRWLDLCDRLGFDALDLEQRGRVAEVDAVAGEASEIKRIRNIVDEDARKRHGNREGEPSWGVIADCVLGHVSQHRQAREILDVPEQFTLDQYVSMLGDGAELVATRQVLEAAQGRTPDPARSTIQLAREVVDQAERWRMDAESYRSEAATLVAKVLTMTAANASAAEVERFLRDFETGLVNAGKWDPYPELPLNLLAREVVAQAERWRIDAEHYRSEASNATAATVESLSAEVARLTGEVAATRSEAARQIGARDAELAALVTRAHRLAADITNEANECTARGLVSPATALRGAAAFLTSVGERVPRVFSAASSVEALHLRLEEADRHLAGLQEEVRQRDEALREETRKVIEYSNLVDQYKLGLAQVQGTSASTISAALSNAPSATVLRHILAAQLRAAAKTANAWEEAAIREWAPLAPDYHDGDGTVTAAIEGPYLEHRLVMAWRGQVQRMADNLSADTSPPATVQRLDYTLLPLGYTMEEDVDADDASIGIWFWNSDADEGGRARNDPPGMQVAGPAGNTTLWSWRLLSGAHEAVLWSRSEAEARAAAWAWYDRRLALHERLRCGLGDRLGRCDGLDFWPLILSWSDDQVAEVERWLVDSTAEMPEVLRG